MKLHGDFIKAAGKGLMCCGVTRSANIFLTLHNIRDMHEGLRSFDWLPWVDIGDGTKVSELMIDNRFWKGLEDVLKASQSFVVVMRLAGANVVPSMGYILHAF